MGHAIKRQSPHPSWFWANSLPRHNDWERAKLAKLAYSSLYCGWITIAKIPKPNARTAVPGVRTLLTTYHDT
jgi:hypothetical protein